MYKLLLALLLLFASCSKDCVKTIDQFKYNNPTILSKFRQQIEDSAKLDIEGKGYGFYKIGDYKFVIYYTWIFKDSTKYYNAVSIYDFNGNQLYFNDGR